MFYTKHLNLEKMVLRISKKNLFASIYMFFIIFMPPVFHGINSLYVLDIISLVILLFQYKKQLLNILKNKHIIHFNVMMMLIMLYVLFRVMIDAIFVNKLELNEYLVVMYRFIGVIFFIQIPVLFMVCYYQKNNFSYNEVCKTVINAGLIEACFTFMALLSPTVKKILVTIFINNVYGSVDNISWGSWIFTERLYGFANVLFDGFGYGTGIIAGLAMFILFTESNMIKNIIIFGILLVVPTVNSITGLFIAVIAIPLVLYFGLKSGKIKGKSIIIVVFLILLMILGLVALQEVAPQSMLRLQDNINAILGKETVNSVTSYGNLLRSSYWVLPSDRFSLLFGTGHDIYTTDAFGHSDVGYTNMIWLLGIVGSVLLYGVFVKLILSACKRANNAFEKQVLLFLSVAFLFFEIKGIGIAINTGIPVIILLSFYSLICNKE